MILRDLKWEAIITNFIEGLEMSVIAFYINSGVLIKTSWYFIYYWEYLDSQSVKSVKWKLNIKKFWLKSYLSPTFAFWTFLLTRITMQQNKATWSPGANFVGHFDVVSLRLSKSSRVSITLGTRVKATYRYNYLNLLRTQ